ncbi:unnamed protein product, partial [marine sediment metagenome]
GSKYHIKRIGLHFDTSDLPDACVISAATLTLYLYWDRVASTDWSITVVNGTDLANPSNTNDYGDLLDDVTSYGTVSTADGSNEGDPLAITINAAGLAQISKVGTTKFALRSSRDIGSDAPTDRELYVLFSRNEAEGAEYRPTLVITYALATFPSDAISRVSNLVHRYHRVRGEYTLEIALGEVISDFGIPTWMSKPVSAATPEDAEPEEEKATEEEAKEERTEEDRGRREDDRRLWEEADRLREEEEERRKAEEKKRREDDRRLWDEKERLR